jgi:hypothetical protein
MPLNSPTGTTNNISFGPAKIFLGEWAARDSNGEYDASVYTGGPKYTGAAGITPAIDVGFIGEDGVNLEMASEKRNIVQGNPQLISYSFATSQSAMFNFTSIEWNFENFRFALGAGSTASPTDGSAQGTASYFNFGGNPLNTVCCMQMQHYMAVSGNTLNIYAWKVQSESGFSIPFSATEEHKFEFSFQALLADYNWGGADLPAEESLIRFERVAPS